MSARSQHQALRVGALVEIMCGPLPVWSGLMSEPDRTTWECTAYGLAAEGRRFLALDAGTTTRNFGTAITNAISRGWAVTNPAPVVGTAAGDADGNPVSVAQLLDDYASQTAQRWGVDAFRRLYMTPGETSPRWLASPDSAAFGTTGEDMARTLVGRYLDSGTNTYETATAGTGAPEEPVDLSSRGAMTAVAASAILGGALARDRGVAWTNGVTLSRSQLQTMGGTPASFLAVSAGQVMRSFGLSYAEQAFALDTVIGKTRYTVGEDVIYVEPVNTAPRTLADVIAAA